MASQSILIVPCSSRFVHSHTRVACPRLYETRDPCLLTSRHHGRSRGQGGLHGHPVVKCRCILFQCIYLRLIVWRRGKRERAVECHVQINESDMSTGRGEWHGKPTGNERVLSTRGSRRREKGWETTLEAGNTRGTMTIEVNY